MSYIFKGKLAGYICSHCPESLSDVMVRLYRHRLDQDATMLAVSSPKDTFAILTDEEVAAKAPLLIAEAKTDINGNFLFDLSNAKDYKGEAFEVDVHCETVPHRKPGRKPPAPLQFSITTLQPIWRQADNALIAAWDYCIPNRFWCMVRRRLGAWTICGEVTVCQSKVPVAGVKVVAFDTDWIQDDEIGSAFTDGAGRFRIDYLVEDFEKTPFSPLINLEWVSGPDLYFRIETPGGTVLLNEPRSRGRDPDRSNAGNCFCLGLCVDKPPVDGTNPIPLFTHVGQYRVDPINHDFTPDGLTTAGNLAFTDTIPLIGLIPNGSAPAPLEYHFRVAEYDPTGTILGAVSDMDPAMISPTVIGQLEYFDWNAATTAFVLRSANYWANNPGVPPTTIHRNGLPNITIQLNQAVKPGGWIEVPRQNDLVPNGQGLFVGGFVSMVQLDTAKLTNEFFDLTAPPPVLNAGEAVPSTKKSRMHRFKLFFEAREVGAIPILAANVLEKIVLSNIHYTQHHHPNWAGYVDTRRAAVLVDVAELAIPGSGCNKVTDHVHALFTVCHPYLGNVSVYIEGQTPPALPAPISPAIMDGEAVSPLGGHDFNIAVQPKCAYILWLRVTLNLTYGYGPFLPDYYDHVAFCKG